MQLFTVAGHDPLNKRGLSLPNQILGPIDVFLSYRYCRLGMCGLKTFGFAIIKCQKWNSWKNVSFFTEYLVGHTDPIVAYHLSHPKYKNSNSLIFSWVQQPDLISSSYYFYHCTASALDHVEHTFPLLNTSVRPKRIGTRDNLGYLYVTPRALIGSVKIF